MANISGLGSRQFRELYFQNPEFGYYFLRLVGERLLRNLSTVEDLLTAERQKLSAALEKLAVNG